MPSMARDQGHYDSFFIRVWSRDDAGEVTHGQVVHLRTHQSMYFRQTRLMLEFIRDKLSRSVPPGEGPSDRAPEEA
jgi:hypothetical protein